MFVLQMNMDDYPHCSLGEDGRLRTTGLHRPGFTRVLWDTLLRLGYDGPAPRYRCRPFQAHGLHACEARVEIPFDPTVPWTGAVIGSEVDDAVEKLAHAALTSLCERSFAATAAMPVALFPIRDQEDSDWQQRLEAISDLKSPRFSAGWAAMAKYSRYLFILQHNTSRIVIEQRARLGAYEEQAIRTSLELERLGRENHILRQRTLGDAGKDRELQVAYRRLSEAEHGLNYARQQLDLAREEVETRTHAIVHLENALETQDATIGEMAEQITTLEQQVQVLQLQVPPAPEDPDEADATSGVDED